MANDRLAGLQPRRDHARLRLPPDGCPALGRPSAARRPGPGPRAAGPRRLLQPGRRSTERGDVDGRAKSWPVPARWPSMTRGGSDSGRDGLGPANGPRRGRGRRPVVEAWRDAPEQLGGSGRRPSLSRRPEGPAALASGSRRRARRIGDTIAYRHHLDQLAALHPGDWLPTARRAASFGDAGQFVEADIEYSPARAARPAGGADLVVLVPGCRTPGHLHGPIRRQPGRSRRVVPEQGCRGPAGRLRVHAHRAEAFERLGRPAEAAAEQERATILEADPAYVAELAGDHALRGEWAKASEYSAIAAARGATDHADRAVICLRTGDRAGYRRACAVLVAAPIAADPVGRDARSRRPGRSAWPPTRSTTTPGRSSSSPRPAPPWTR